MAKRKSYIGIDVSKQLLEVAVYESDFHYRCPNQASAFAALLAELIALRTGAHCLGSHRWLGETTADFFAGRRLTSSSDQPAAGAGLR